jgi:hypothetical protein
MPPVKDLIAVIPIAWSTGPFEKLAGLTNATQDRL